MPDSVSPAQKQSAFSCHVPSSSFIDRVILPQSFDFMTAVISSPHRHRSPGWDILDTDIESIGSRAMHPQPISQNAPKLSRCVTRAFTISPERSRDI